MPSAYKDYLRSQRLPGFGVNQNLFKKHRKDAKQDKQIARLSRVVSTLETKHKGVDDPQATNQVPHQQSNTYLTTLISDIVPGDGDSGRTGDKVNITGLDFDIYLWSANGTYEQCQVFRYIIFRDMQYSQVAVNDATGSDLLTDYGTTDGSLRNMLSPLNADNCRQYGDTRVQRQVKRFQIIKDKVVTLTTPAAQGDSPPKVFRHRLRFKKGNKIAQYSGTANKAGAIFVTVFPGCDTTAASNPWYVWRSNLYYTDI